MAQTASNAFRYARQLKHCAEGICVWHPTTRGAVGDVGYIHDGYFNCLFNVFDAPDGLPSLPHPDQGIVTDMQDNSHLAWMNIEGGNYTVGAGIPVATEVVSLGFEISSHTADGAFLVPGGQARKVEQYLDFQLLVDYLGDHYATILRMFPHRPWDQCSLMILRGTTHATGWCRGIARQTARGVSGTISINLPTLGIPVLGLDIATQRARLNHWLIGTGPPAGMISDSPPTAVYCIVVKPVIVRRRTTLQYRIASAVVPVGERMKSFMSRFQASSSSGVRPTSTTHLDSTNNTVSGEIDGSEALELLQRDGVGSDEISTVTSEQHQRQFNALPDSSTSFSLQESLLDDDVDPRDELEELLDVFLDKHPDFDAAIGSWELLSDFHEHYGSPACSGEIDYAFLAMPGIAPHKVAKVQHISRRIIEHAETSSSFAPSRLADTALCGASLPCSPEVSTRTYGHDDNDSDTRGLSHPQSRPTRPISSSSAAERMPSELLIHALRQLQPGDLQASLLVSRHWFDCGVELVWEKPRLHNPVALRSMLEIVSSSEQTIPYGELVRRLNFLPLGNELSDQDLRSLKNCNNLERLTLAYGKRLSDGILSELLRCTPSLLTLDLTDTLVTSDADLQVVAATSPKLLGLNVSNCARVTDTGIIAIATSCPSLQRIKLMGLDAITSSSLDAIAFNCPQLVELDLVRCSSISDSGVRNVWLHLQTLRELKLAHCVGLTDEAHPPHSHLSQVAAVPPASEALDSLLLNHLQDRLRFLDLSGCNKLTDDAIVGIISHAGRISSLVLAKCTQLTDRTVHSICNLRHHLNEVHLGYLSQITDSGVVELARACTNLRYIDLALCLNLSDVSITAISAIPNLQRVGLVRVSNLTDEAVFALANRPTIERIHLSYCPNISVAAIAHLLERLDRLAHLSLTGVSAFCDGKLDLDDIRRAPPAEFSAMQRAVFYVFSGRSVQELRERLRAFAASPLPTDGKFDAAARPAVVR